MRYSAPQPRSIRRQKPLIPSATWKQRWPVAEGYYNVYDHQERIKALSTGSS